MKNILLSILGFFVLTFFIGCNTLLSGYNGAIRARNACDAQYANVDTALQRRTDLVPNLVETVKGAAGFEKSTLEAVVNARAAATQVKLTTDDLSDPEKMKRFQVAQDELGKSLGRLLAVSENYPALRATDSFRDLQAQLEGTENRISEERRKYNLAVQDMNNSIQTFPSNIGASMAGVHPRHPFEAVAGSDKPPTVKF